MQGRFWSEAIESFISSSQVKPQIAIEQAFSPELTQRLRKGDIDVAFCSRVEAVSYTHLLKGIGHI